MYIEPNIQYGGDNMVLDIYRPFNGASWPVVFSVHGGGWVEGNEDSGPTLQHALSLVDHGFYGRVRSLQRNNARWNKYKRNADR